VNKHERCGLCSTHSESTKTYKMLGRKYQKRHHFEDLSIDVGIILRLISQKYCVKLWTGFSWLWMRSDTSSYKHGNDLRGSIKAGNFLVNYSRIFCAMELITTLPECPQCYCGAIQQIQQMLTFLINLHCLL
jgi:hypothetical protein